MNKTTLIFQNVVCTAMWSLVINCFKWKLAKEQTVVNLFTMLLLKVCLCLMCFTWYTICSPWHLPRYQNILTHLANLYCDVVYC